MVKIRKPPVLSLSSETLRVLQRDLVEAKGAMRPPTLSRLRDCESRVCPTINC